MQNVRVPWVAAVKGEVRTGLGRGTVAVQWAAAPWTGPRSGLEPHAAAQ